MAARVFRALVRGVLIIRISLGLLSVLPATAAGETFETIAWPFLEAHCVKCHGAKKQKGDVALHDLDPRQLGEGDAALWAKVVEVLKFQEMPPEDPTTPETPTSST